MPRSRKRSCRNDRPGASLTMTVILVTAGGLLSNGQSFAQAVVDEAPPKATRSTGSDPAGVEFFEKEVRPILSARCHGCHGPAKQKGGLRLDARETVLAGGSTGPAIIPGSPKDSLLVDAINYGETYHMPPKSKLPPAEIATLTEWVQRGAPWGIGTPAGIESSGAGKIPGALSKKEFAARARFWSFQPLARATPPPVNSPRASWAQNPIDRFILAALELKNLTPAPEAGKRTLIRRLSFDLTGLPPTPQDVEAFLNDQQPGAFERLVDRLLASPHYGERWARHWLDLVRYAETAGHEFDYDIPNAFRYRDYVIRAFNLDVPYDQFVVEHTSGDALEPPRRHPVEGFNESAIATGFYVLGEGTHSPVDIREEQMRRIDNQLDVFSKTFLGLTLACARCHDHKFDPITAEDYYALAGYLVSSRHQQAFIDPPDRIGKFATGITDVKKQIAAILVDARDQLPQPLRIQATTLVAPPGPSSSPAQRPAGITENTPIGRAGRERVFEDFNRDRYDGWFVTGNAFGERPTCTGDFQFDRDGSSTRLISVLPGLAHSSVVSERLQGVLRSRSFTIESRFIHFLTAGRGGRISVVIDGFEKIRSPIYGGLTTVVNTGPSPRWVTLDVEMWMGHSAYLEIADGAVVDFGGATSHVDDGNGWIAVDEVRTSDNPTPETAAPHAGSQGARANLDLTKAIAALRVTRPIQADRLAAAVAQAIALEMRIPAPTLAPAQTEGTGMNEHVHIRGSHKGLGNVVPRRFLTVLGGSGSQTSECGSGRNELARGIVDPAVNPLVPRVLVNRLWQHHFGEGIVRSIDDFGAMGQKPSHPALLDWLACKLVESGWSIKSIHRLMLTSNAYRMSSLPNARGEQVDPGNVLLHRMNVRRLEAESIRDALLAVSGQLSPRMYGPSVPVHLTSYMEGRGRPGQSGPLDGNGRRSIYLNVRRNFLNPMFLAFDAPVPFSTMGRRNVSNVPGQALTLMNDPLVIREANLWAKRIMTEHAISSRGRVDKLYSGAFGRPPSALEAGASQAFLDGHANGPTLEAWADLCHVLLNMKDFIFLD
jgi:mono/diheme cytochrome c family protein